MTNSIQKGKRVEREVANELKHIFPDIRRNWHEQTAKGGSDLAGCDGFNFEVKSGAKTDLKTIQNWLEQVREEGIERYWDVVVAKPDRKDKYVVLPFDDFKELLEVMKAEGII